jgi:hypothetical protein
MREWTVHSYFDRTVSYAGKMFMKLSTGFNFINLFSLSMIFRTISLECMPMQASLAGEQLVELLLGYKPNRQILYYIG